VDIAAAARRVQIWLVVGVLVASAVVVYPPAVEPFMLPKATLVVAFAVVLLACAAVRALWSRRLTVPVSPPVLAVLAFLAAAVVATLTSPTPWTSLIGFYGRYSGLVPYLAYAVVFFTVLALADVQLVRLLTRAALVAAGLVVAYGLFQAAGLEPVGFLDNGLPGAFSTFGNVNFSAAWVGAITGLMLATAASDASSRPWRLYAAALLPAALLYAVLTTTSQALVVSMVALGWSGLLLATGSPGLRGWTREHKRSFFGTLAAAVVLVAALAWLLAPRARAALDQALVERPEFWSAALAIWRDHPALGTGLDTYAHHFLAYRPASHALANGTATTDAPHSVPLAMLSNGGLLLAATYLAVVVAVGVVLVRGARRSEGPARVALAGWGGVWLGYQAQSLVSFDVPPLAVLHWVSAAIILALAAPPRWRQVTLPGRPAAAPRGNRGRRTGSVRVAASTYVLSALTAVVALVAVWFVVYPLRADLVAAGAAPLTAQGRYDEAAERFERAARLNPAEGSYPFLAARAHEAAGRPEAALERAQEAAERDPGTVQYAVFAARQAQALGNSELAARWYREAVDRDPKDPPVLNEAAAFLVAAGDDEGARELYGRVLKLDPDNEDARSGLETVD
jgi:Flp pilus assembly protein TadD/O-antigen ligase